MSTTRAVRFHTVGEPEVLQVEEVPIPIPKDHEIRVKMQAIGLNRAEVMFRRGQYRSQPNFPAGIGFEGAGIVDAIGAKVTHVKVGDKVAVTCTDMFGYPTNAELAVLPPEAIWKYPSKLTTEEVASAYVAYLTAYFVLFEVAKLSKDQFILITAASSSASLGALQLAKAVGAKVIAATRSEKKKQRLLEVGADHVIVTETEDLEKRVLEITAGKGANVILDAVGGPQFETLAKVVADYGYLLLYGVLSPQPTVFPVMQLFPKKGVSVQVYSVYHFFPFANKEASQRAMTFINEHLEKGTFKPIVAKVFPGIHSIVEAHRYLESNEQFGKVVVKI